MLESYRLRTVIDSVYLVPDFVSSSEESSLLDACAHTKAKKTQLKGRRVLTLGGIIAGSKLLPAPLPTWLQSVNQHINNLKGLPWSGFNHVLVNEYAPDGGIMAHQDGPVYEPCVAILSLGSCAVMRFYEKQGPDDLPSPDPCCSVVLPPRSLLVFANAAYSSCLHGIDACAEHVLDASVVNPWAVPAAGEEGLLRRQGLRTSLTFRRARQTCAIVAVARSQR